MTGKDGREAEETGGAARGRETEGRSRQELRGRQGEDLSKM